MRLIGQAEGYLTEKKAFLLIGLLASLLYLPSLFYGFVLDDVAVITQNQLVKKGLSGWGEIFTGFYWEGYQDFSQGLYRPLSSLMFALEWQLFPGNPVPGHLLNILLYGLSCGWLASILFRLFPESSRIFLLLLAGFFAVHPIHTEVVANIKSRDELLSFFFFTWGLQLLMRDLSAICLQVGLGVIVLLALFSKESAILFVPVFFLVMVYLRDVPLKVASARLLPAAGMVVLWLGWRFAVLHILNDPPPPVTYRDNTLLICPGGLSQLATVIYLSGLYLLKCVWPVHLLYDYSFFQVPCMELFSPRVVISIVVYLVLIACAWIYRDKQKMITFGILFFFFLMTLPSQLLVHLTTTMGDRLMFVPVLGIILAAGGFLQRYFRSSSILLPALIIPGLLFAFFTIKRMSDWRSMETLLESDARKEGVKSFRILSNYGALYENNPQRTGLTEEQGLDSAIIYFQRALAVDPSVAEINEKLAGCYFKRKKYPEAIYRYSRALQLDSSRKDLLEIIGNIYFHSGKTDSARYFWQSAIDCSGARPGAYISLAVSFFQDGSFREAESTFRKGWMSYPGDRELALNFSGFLLEQKRFGEGISLLKDLYERDPSEEVLKALASVYAMAGDSANYRYYYKQIGPGTAGSD